MITYVATRDGPLFGSQYAAGEVIDTSSWDHKEIQRLLSVGAITSQSTAVTSDGVTVPSRAALEFTGAYVNLLDDPDNDTTTVQVQPPSTAPLGLLKVWRDGNTAASLGTTETVAYSSIWTYTFVAGRSYEFTVSGHGAASTTNAGYGQVVLRLGTTITGVAPVVGYVDQTILESVFFGQQTFIAGTDFAAGSTPLSVTGRSAAGTITLGSSVKLLQTMVRVVDLGVV